MIKNNSKVVILKETGLKTIRVNCKLPLGAQTRDSIWDNLANRYPRTFGYKNKVEIHLDYAYELGYPFTPPSDLVRILHSPRSSINFEKVSVGLKIL